MFTHNRLLTKSVYLLVALATVWTGLPMAAPARAVTFPVSRWPLPVAQLEEEAPADVSLYAVVEPAEVAAGAEAACTVTLVNEGAEALTGWTLSARLPRELTATQDGRRTHRWQVEVEPLSADEETAEVTLPLSVGRQAAGPLAFAIELRDAEGALRATTTAVVGVAEEEQQRGGRRVEAMGGEFVAPAGRVRVQFPPGALRGAVEVTARVQGQGIARRGGAGGRSGRLLRFSLEARDAGSGAAVERFDEPVALALDLRGLLAGQGLLPGQHLYLIHILDAETGEAEDVPFEYDPATGVLTAQLDHFSDYETGAVGEGWEPMLTLPVADRFSGAATYSYPIVVPAGRNGLQPGLTVSYSSRRLDGLLGGEGKLDSTPLPLGWTLGGVPEITRSSEYEGGKFYLRDQFTLALNGTSYELKAETAGQTCGQYYVENGPSIYVERRNNSSGCGNGSAENQTSDYWIVRTADGTKYTMGSTTNSEVDVWDYYKATVDIICYGYCSGTGGYKNGQSTQRGAIRWRVNQVTGPLTDNDRVAFTYREKVIQVESDLVVWRSAPALVEYNYDGSAYLSKVQLVFDSDDSSTNDYMRVIRIEVVDDGETVRKYVFSTSKSTWSTWCEKTYEQWKMNGIQELGRDGGGLPGVSFEHVRLNNKPGNCSPYWRVSAANNGYGGRAEFSYVGDGRYVEAGEGYGYSYRVSEARTYDGIHGTAAKVNYSYGMACYDQTGSNGRPCKMSADAEEVGPLVGHDWVNETVTDYDGAVLGYSEHDYYICPDNNPANCADWEIGRELLARAYSAPGQALLQQTETTWVNAPFGNGAPFVYTPEVIATDYSGGASAIKKTEYAYDTGKQGGAQYGNLTHVKEYDEVGVLYRTTVTEYIPNPNTTVWIVDKPKVVRVVDKTGQQVSRSKYYYDNHSSWGALPTQGLLVKEDRVLLGMPDPHVVTEYWYDGWGKLTKTKDPRGYESTIAYDSTYHLYPVQTCNALTQCSVTEYYGINASGACFASGYYHGAVCRAYGPNGPDTATHYAYDQFGRTIKVVRPGDSEAKPTTEYVYHDGALFWRKVRQREESGGGALDAYTYYDGLGRVIQTQTPADEWGGPSAIDDLPGSGAMQVQSPYVIGSTLYQDFWRGDQGWSRTVPIVNGAPQWGSASAWSGPWSLSLLPGSGSMQVQSAYIIGSTLYQDIWRGDQGWSRTVPIVNGAPQWGSASAWSGPWLLSWIIGSGSMQAQSAYVIGSTLYQDIWRGDQGWSRTVPIVNGVPQWGSASAWSGPWSLSGLSGSGSMQAQSAYVLGSALYQDIWRGGEGWSRTVPIVNGVPQCGLSGRGIVQDTQYNALGQVSEQSVPYAVDGYYYDHTGLTNAYRAPDTSQPRSITQYDALGRVVQVDSPDGTRTRTYYRGWGVAVIDANNHQRIQESDGLGRLVKVREYGGTYAQGPNWSAGPYATTAYAYDALDNLVKVTDALGNVITMTYDALGRKVAMHDPDMGDWTYTYDKNGNLKTQTDAKGQTIAFTYDPVNRLTLKDLPSGTDVHYYYDEAGYGESIGQRTRMTDGSGWTKYYYEDARSRLSREQKSINGGGIFTTWYTYDALDRVVTMKYPDNEVVTHTYNNAGQLKSLSGWNAYVQSASYSALGQMTSLPLGNGRRVHYNYFGPDTQQWGNLFYGRLFQVCVVSQSDASCPYNGASNALLNLSYWYDDVGNVVSIRDRTNGNQVQNFSYDALDRLTHAWTTGGGQGAYDRTYAYNEIGNLLSKTGVGSYYYLDGAHKHAVTHLNGTSSSHQKYWYDANGNMTKRVESGSCNQTFNAENKLVQVSGAASASFSYDGDGNRVKKVEGGVTTYYPSAGSGQAVGGYYEKQGSTVTKYYYFGGKRVAMRKGSTLTYLHGDHLGSTSLATDGTSGAKVSRVLYFPYGETRHTEGTLPTDFKYTGQREEDGLGGLYDYNARYYDPYLGRFISADSIVPNPANPQDLNRYAYTRNNPVRYTDPSGHCIPGKDPHCEYDEGGGVVDHRWHTNIGVAGQLPAMAAYEHFLENPEYFVHLYFDDPTNEELGQLSDYAVYHDGVPLETLMGMQDADYMAALAFADLREQYDAGLIDGPTFWEKGKVLLGIVTLAAWSDGNLEYGGASNLDFGGGGIPTGPRGGSNRIIDDTSDDILEWLGDNPRAIRNQYGDLVIVSEDGLRRFRADFNHPAPHENPHVHLDWFEDGSWHTERIWPFDVDPQ